MRADRPDIQLFLLVFVFFQLLLRMDHRMLRRKFMLRQIHIFQNAHIRHNRVFFSVRRQQRDAFFHGIVDGDPRKRFAVHTHSSRELRELTKNRLQEFTGAGPLQAGESKDLAFLHTQRNIRKARAADLLKGKHVFAERTRRIDLAGTEATAHHRGCDLLRICLGDLPAPDKFAVAKDCIAVGNTEDLRHLMRNEDKGFPFILQFIYKMKKVIDLFVAECCCRFIQDQQLCLEENRLCDLKRLFFTGAQMLYRR